MTSHSSDLLHLYYEHFLLYIHHRVHTPPSTNHQIWKHIEKLLGLWIDCGVLNKGGDATFCMQFDFGHKSFRPTGEQSCVTRRVFVDFERFRFIIIFHLLSRNLTLITSSPLLIAYYLSSLNLNRALPFVLQ